MAGKKSVSKARKALPAGVRKSGAAGRSPARTGVAARSPAKGPAKGQVKVPEKVPEKKVPEKKVAVPVKKPVSAPKSTSPKAVNPVATVAPVAAAAPAGKPVSQLNKAGGKGPAKPLVAVATMRASTVTMVQPEDADSMEPGSLLAGPRNVKPYVAKRGERYMSQEQLQHFQTILQSWKRDLMVEVDRTVNHMKDEAANFPDPNDRATQEEEFSLELRTRDRERKLIRKIDEALKRVEDGSYGYCLETGEEIGIKRLEARPVATLTIEAQERRERRERQYGDREDRYR
jgi:DnaK suppressor protein